MNTLKNAIAISLFMAVALNVAAMGEDKGMKGNMPSFSDFDANGDGKIVEQEFNEMHAKKMSKMAEEGRQMKHAAQCPGFSGIDTDDNGEISQQEMTAHQHEHHEKMQQHKKSEADSQE